MNAVVIALSRAVRRAPVIVLLTAVALTALIGSFASQIVQGGGNEGFSPDNPELRAQQRVQEVFGGGDVIVQVLLRGEDGADVLSAAGVAATVQLQQALQASPVAELLVADPARPAVVSPLTFVLGGGPDQPPVDPATLDDAAVDAGLAAALEQLPPEQAGVIPRLLPAGTDPAGGASDLALAVISLDASAVPEDDVEQAEAIAEVARVVESVDVPGVVLEPFAFQLLFATQDDFAAEIARLFASAIGIIVAILALVFFVRPREDSSWGASLRRTAADTLLTLVVVMMAIGWVQGVAGLLGPNVLGVIGPLAETGQIVPVLLIGLGVDYGIHLTSRYREETGAGSVSEAVGTATRTVGIALVLATVTTVVGFLTNLTAPVPALRDFGILAAVGILAAFLLMLTVFPAVRLLLDRRAEAAGRLPRQTLTATGEGALQRAMGGLAVLAERLPVATLAVFAGVGGVLGGIGLANVSTEFSFTDFLPADSPLVATFDTITERFGGGFGERTTVVVEGELDAEGHNALVAATQALADLEDVDRLGERPDATSPISLLGQVAGAARGGSAGLPAATPPPGAPPVDPALVGQLLAQLDPDGLTVPAGTDVGALYDLLGRIAPQGAAQVIAPDADVVRFDISTSAGEQGAAVLADELDAAFAPVEAVLGEDSVVVTSDSIISTEITTSLRDSQLQSLFIAIAAAMALLVLTYGLADRRPLLGVITIAPVALVVLWTFGMMAATGVPIGPVTATIAALAVGIGVPYTIHVTNRWDEDRRTQPTPEAAIRATVRHTGGALAGSALTTVAGFGILVTSSLTPFQQFGLVTAYSIGFALVAATVVLPSMLVLYDRRLRRRADQPGGPA